MWGEWLSEKWDQATDAGREAATAVAETAGAMAQAAKDAAVAAGQAAKDAAVATWDATKSVANTVDNAARNAARSAERSIVSAGGTAVAGVRRAGRAVGEAWDKTKDGVRGAVNEVRELFGYDPIAAPVAACPVDTEDGDYLVPNAEGGCDRVKSGETPAETKAAITAAKASSASSTSDCCSGKPASQRNKTVFYTNGINTDRNAHCASLHKMADITCGKVVGIFNSTEGALTDAMRTADARDFIRRESAGGAPSDYDGFSPAVDTVQRTMINELLAEDEFTMFAHSEGGAITSLGTMRAINDLEAQGDADLVGKASITSMGSAAPSWKDGPEYDHYIHVNDTTPNLLGLGDRETRGGANARYHRFEGDKTGGFSDNPSKRPWAPTSPVADHNINDSYLEYYNDQVGGCGNES